MLLLWRPYGMILKLKRTPGIYLVGFMGCGKSTVGRALADELGWRFVDLDAEIEKAEGTPIAEIFDTRGEAAFRLIEAAALRNTVRKIECGQPHVVALGGGAFLQDNNATLLSDKGVSIWLDCPFAMVQQRVGGDLQRPLAREPEKFRALYETRRPLYARADYRIDIHDDNCADAVKQILALGLV
jgi:shikimate kinase